MANHPDLPRDLLEPDWPERNPISRHSFHRDAVDDENHVLETAAHLILMRAGIDVSRK
jgi:hypothetical protein